MRLDRNFVNGQFIEPATDELISVYNPATEALIAQVAGASKDEAIAAVKAAATAQKGWRKLPGAERAVYLHKLARAVSKAKSFRATPPTRIWCCIVSPSASSRA